MYNEIIEKLIEIQKSGKVVSYSEFSNLYGSDSKLFSDTLIELRNTELSCIDDELLIKNINNCSSLFSGKDIIFLNLILLMLYFEIDIRDNVDTMLSIFKLSKFEKQHAVMRVIYDMHLTKIFTKSFSTYSDTHLLCEIDDYIDINVINTIPMIELYYSVIKENTPRLVKKLPKKIYCVGMVQEAFRMINGNGLRKFYTRFKTDYITSLCDFLKEIGGERFADIIIYGIESCKDQRKLDHLENKISNLEKKIPIEKLLINYIEHSEDISVSDA